MGLRKAGANWVEGDRFYNRESELEALTERVGDGIHTLLTAQRRIGKTSLVRELLRRLAHEGRFETIFVDLEDVGTPEAVLSDPAPVQHLLLTTSAPRPGPLGRGAHTLHGGVLRTARAKRYRR